MFQLATSFALALMSTAAFAGRTASPNATDMHVRLQAFECRCRFSQFLSMPHANITSPSKTGGCHSYSMLPACTILLCSTLANVYALIYRTHRRPWYPGTTMSVYDVLPMIQAILEQFPGGASLPVEYPAGVTQNTTSGESFVKKKHHQSRPSGLP